MKAMTTRCAAILAVLVLFVALFVNLPARGCELEKKTDTATTVKIICGLVSSSSGQVIGITVRLYDIYNNSDAATTLSDAGGVYSFKNVAPGYYQVRIASQYINNKVYFEQNTDQMTGWVPRFEPGEVRWKNFTLYEQDINAHIIGKVTDDDTKNPHPVSGAVVTITDPAHNYLKSATTGANGSFDMDYYAGTFTIDIVGKDSYDTYSYSGPLTLKGDGEMYGFLDKTPVVKNYENSMVMLAIKVNGEKLTEGLGGDYTVNYTSGELNFTYDFANRDEIRTHYHWLDTHKEIVWADTLTPSGGWDGKATQLNFTYGHIEPSTLAIKKNGAVWMTPKGNYTIDYINGTLRLDPNSTISQGEPVTARYETTEREISDEYVLTSGENKKNFTLAKNWVEGYAIDETTEPIYNVTHVTMYDKTEKKMLSSVTDGQVNYFKISVPNAFVSHAFILVVHPDGYNPYTNVSFTPTFVNGKHSLGPIVFSKSIMELFEYEYAFKATRDWNNITVNMTYTWNAGSNFPGVGNENLGNMRFQLDLKFGNSDGVLNSTERQTFKTWLETITPNYVSTQKFITLNDSAYNSSATDPKYNVISVIDNGGDNVKVDSTKTIEITTTVNAKVSGKKFDSPKYAVKLTVDYDTAGRNSTYMVKLPKYYVRTSGNPDPDNLLMDGYTGITIDPKGSASGSTVVDLVVEKAVNATPVAKILTWNGKDAFENETHAYSVPDKNNTYIVAKGHNITFSSEGSIPAVGEIIGYNWSFGDGAFSGWTKNKTVTHKYTQDYSNAKNKTVNFTVTLEVKNSLGNRTKTNKTDSLTVRADSLDPTVNFTTHLNESHTEGDIKFVQVVQYTTKADKKLPAGYIPTNRTLVTWIKQAIIFNASASFDSLIEQTKKDGTIRYWSYDFGNSNKSGNLTSALNYTFAGYSKPGKYDVTLNVTDVVGRYSAYKITVVVKPTPGFWTQDAKYKNVTVLKEKTKYVFVANVSMGPYPDTIRSANISWNFEFPEDKTLSKLGVKGNMVEFTFPKNGAWNISLNTTDLLGNYAINTTKVVIMPGPHPDVAVMSINFSVETPEEGSEVWISVNVSNSPGGTPDNASNVIVKIYDDRNKNWKGDAGELIGTATNFNGTTFANGVYTKLDINHWVIAKLRWVPEGSYEHLIIVNISCDNELASTTYNNEKNKSVYVNPAKWKTWALVGGTIIVIIIALVLIYAWKTGKLSNFRRRRKERLGDEVSKGKEYRKKWEKDQKDKEKK